MIKKQYIQTNGIKLHVVEDGPSKGEPIIFLHGFPEFWYGWKKQISYFANHGFRAIVPDQRGYNLSDKPKSIQDYSVQNLIQDIAGLMDAKGYERINLVGHDWGGAVAWYFAMKWPERLKRLVILNVPHPKVMLDALGRNWRQTLRSWYMFFFQLPYFSEFIVKRNNFQLLRKILKTTSLKGTFSEEDIQQYTQAWSQPNSLKSMINWYRASFRDSLNRFKRNSKENFQINTPTLLIWGEKDQFLGSELAKPSISYCHEGKVEFIKESSHWVQHEFPDRINKLIKDFISKNPKLPRSSIL
ncbi:MAG: alpha/beta hydrolase [Deltaproteobacteria bacterium]|nr:alpha/beta hydrolase [Deltaproteobacteria bacterium]